jgi:hypothetical protein
MGFFPDTAKRRRRKVKENGGRDRGREGGRELAMNIPFVYDHHVFMTLQVFLGNSSSAASLPNRQDEVTSKLIHLAAVNVHESKDSFHRL